MLLHYYSHIISKVVVEIIIQYVHTLKDKALRKDNADHLITSPQ